MIDVSAKGTTWIKNWAGVSFSPTHFFESPKFRLDAGAFEFGIGNLLLSFITAVIASFAYFDIFYRRVLSDHIQGTGFKEFIAMLSILAGVYALVLAFGMLTSSALSFLAFKYAGSTREFTDHFAIYLFLCNAEPFAAIAITLFLLPIWVKSTQAVGPTRGTYLHIIHPWITGIFFSIYIVLRLYSFALANIAFRSLHRVPRMRSRQAFVIGYLPLAVLGTMASVVVLYGVAQLIVDGLD
jgi:hypothetical protein